MSTPARSGGPLRIPAADWNRLRGLLQRAEASRAGLGINPASDPWHHNAIIRIKNATGGPRAQWDIVGLDAPLVSASDNAQEFTRLAVNATTPNHAHRGRFAVLLQSLPAGAIGDAIAVGLAPVRILEPQAEAPQVADITVGECAYLTPSSTGVPVLFAEPPDAEGIRLAVVNLSPGVAAPPADVNPCCGCPPTRCYDFNGQKPHAFTIDFGDLLCCDGLAGGVKRLNWTGSAWVSPMFWCNPDGGAANECGTAVYVWRNEANPCAGATATYRWQPGTPLVPGVCPGGEWTQIIGCPDGCTSSPPPPPDPFGISCETVFQDVPCTGGTPTAPGWELVSSTCSCGESSAPPDRDGDYDGEEVTVICPGAPPDPPTIDCTGDYMTERLWEGDDIQEAKDLGVYAAPGTVLWTYTTIHCVAPQYVIVLNGCDPLEIAAAARPEIDPGDLTWLTAPPTQSLPTYIVTACPSEPCPPPGKVPARWMLIPPTGYEPARVELRVNQTVRLRYVLPPGRVFCERCLNRFTIEQTGCDWPCDNIPENICARPGDGAYAKSNCLPLASAYALSVPEMTVANPAWGHIAAGQMAMAAGDYVLDLVNNAGMDPRFEDNGCRTITPSCCTWRAPYSGVGTEDHPCVPWAQLGWVLQTCSPQRRTGLTAKRFQNYSCSDDAVPALYFGLYDWRAPATPGLTGPAVIQWTGFFGDNYHPGGFDPSWGDGPGNGVCGASDCCWQPGDGCGDGDIVFDPSTVSENAYYLVWNYVETLEDGTLVMRMDDSLYAGWVTAFPQTINLAPA